MHHHIWSCFVAALFLGYLVDPLNFRSPVTNGERGFFHAILPLVLRACHLWLPVPALRLLPPRLRRRLLVLSDPAATVIPEPSAAALPLPVATLALHSAAAVVLSPDVVLVGDGRPRSDWENPGLALDGIEVCLTPQGGVRRTTYTLDWAEPLTSGLLR